MEARLSDTYGNSYVPAIADINDSGDNIYKQFEEDFIEHFFTDDSLSLNDKDERKKFDEKFRQPL